MDPMGEEQLDYGEEEYGGSQKIHFQGTIPALAEEEMMPYDDDDDEDYDDLYSDVNVGEAFTQSLQHPKSEPPPSPTALFRNVGPPSQNPDGLISTPVLGTTEQNPSAGFVTSGKGLGQGSALPPDLQRNVGFQGASSAAPMPPNIGEDPKFSTVNSSVPSYPGNGSIKGGAPVLPAPMHASQAGLVGNHPVMNEGSRQGVNLADNNGQVMLFVGELHWWTTDAEIESVAARYGRVKEIKFFDERASGKSKGYCQLEFYDPYATAACKEGMNGFLFNGRACVVTFASAQSLRQMGAAYTNKNQSQVQSQQQGRRPMNEGGGRGGMNFQGGDGGRNNGRGGWGRGGQGFNNRGPGVAGPMRGRGFPGAKGMVGATGGMGAGAPPYGQGLAGSGLGGPGGGLMHPQGMMGAAFDPTFMGRGGPYGGFPTHAFPGMMPSFQAVNAVGLSGVAPHVNPAFFGRGMTANGMGLISNNGMEGHSAGMWTDTSMIGWGGDEHERRARESSYGGDDGASDYGYGEVNHERGGRSNAPREKDMDWSSNSEQRHRDEKDRDWDRAERERYREEKDGYRDHRQRDRDRDDGNNERGQSSSRSRSKMHEEDHRSRSRDADYGKRRRMPSE